MSTTRIFVAKGINKTKFQLQTSFFLFKERFVSQINHIKDRVFDPCVHYISTFIFF